MSVAGVSGGDDRSGACVTRLAPVPHTSRGRSFATTSHTHRIEPDDSSGHGFFLLAWLAAASAMATMRWNNVHIRYSR